MAVNDEMLKRRRELGMTQEKVSQGAGMNITQYNGYERGRSSPTPPTLERIAKALSTTTEVLLNPGLIRSPQGSVSRTDLLSRLRSAFGNQVAEVLDLAPEDINIRIEILSNKGVL
jgi:transcriptional regulator with XRE-family HTH domain